MSLALPEHLPLIASAPDGIQKLRGLILELAVRGKLLQGFSAKDEGWKRGLFSDFFTLEYGDNLPAPKRSGTGEYPVYGSNGVVGTHNECSVTAPCIVVGRKGSAGALNCCRDTGCWVTDVAYYCVPPANINLDFTLTLFQTLSLDQLGKGIKPGLSRNEAYSLPVAIPPINEQLRIVAKVNELMALCDRLESEQNDSAAAHTQLVEALLGTLTQSADAADFEANWKRIAEHFDTLFTTEPSIDALQKTILQLAVMGKLVPQDPKDEPASQLLERITQDRKKLESDGTCKKLKPTSSITETEQAFSLPIGWEWTRLGTLLSKIGAGSTPLGGKQVYVKKGIAFLRSQNVWNDGLRLDEVAFILPGTHQKMSGTHVEPGDLLFNITGASIGRCAMVPENFVTGNVSQHVTIIRPVDKENSQFLHKLLISELIQKTVMDVQVGVSREGLSIGKLAHFVIPIPPLAEQRRIVAKIDLLVSVCDQLKASIKSATTMQGNLSSALIQKALEAA